MRRPPSVLRAVTAVLISTLLVGACVAKVNGATGAQRNHGRTATMGTAVAAPNAPQNAAEATLDGLDARVQQATQQAADSEIGRASCRERVCQYV